MQKLIPRLVALRPLLFCVVGLGCYLNAWHTPFVFDDIKGIVESPGVRQLWPPAEVMDVAADETPWGRPVVAYSLAVNYAISGLDVWSYRLLNLAIHIGAACILFELVRRLLLDSGVPAAFKSQADGVALASTLLWLAHPFATSVVTYTIQRAESLMALFYLLALYLAICSFEGRRNKRLLQVGTVVACCLGVASKESAATAPLAILMLDWGVLKNGAVLRRRTAFYASLAGSWILLAALMLKWPRSGSVGGTQIQSLDYFLMQWQVIVHYMKSAVLAGGLSLDYDWPQPDLAQALPYGLFLTVLAGGAAWLFFRRRLAWPFTVLFVFLVLGPTSSFVPIHTSVAADNRFYLPLAGVIVLGVVAIASFLQQVRWRPATGRAVAYALTTALVLTLGALTIARNEAYQSTVTIWRDVTDKQPWNERAWNNLGGNLHLAGESDEALTCLQRAVELNPEYASALSSYGYVLGQCDRAKEAIIVLQRAITLDPMDVAPRINLGGVAYYNNDLDLAATAYRGALALEPQHAGANFDLAVISLHQGRLQKGLEHVARTLETEPDYPEAAQLEEELKQRLKAAGG